MEIVFMIDYEMFNRNLSEVEAIISSKYHFRFMDISKDDTDSTDLVMSVLQARVITEGMCRFIVLQEHLVKDEKSIRTATLKVYVDDLLRPNLIVPKPIITNLSTIQGISNLAVHFQAEGYLDLKETYICLESLDSVLSWFVKRYASGSSRNNGWKISSDMLNKSGTVPPKAEGWMIPRNREVVEIRNEIILHKRIVLRGCTGVGKTELAKDYAKKYNKKYDGIYYAENIDGIDDYLYNLPIGIIDEELKTKKEIVEEKLEVIHSMDLTYLFILDNYTGKKEELCRLYPCCNDKYHLMILVSDDYEVDDKRCCYEVNSFSPEESFQIFRYYCEGKYEDEEVDKLLSYLSYNPRAIKMSAVFLRDNDSYSPYGLIDSMKKNSSIKSIMQNLYTILTEISFLDSDMSVKMVAQCLSLIPYNGVLKERFITLLSEGIKSCTEDYFIEESIEKLEASGWMSIDNMGFVSMNPLLSDIIFEKTHPDMTSKIIVDFIAPILKPTQEIRELFLTQIIALEPFVEHLTKRAESAKSCDLGILNDIREYYIAVYNIPKIELVTMLMEREFERHTLSKTNIVENAIYRQGISRFNLEDFSEAHMHFLRALDMLSRKKNDIEKIIARISAYEGASLAVLGDREKAIENVKRSIKIRERLAELGDLDEEKALWISHYNYAKVLLKFERYEEAEKEIDIAISIYEKYYSEEYLQRKSTNVSSLFQLKGRIFSGLEKYDEAIKLLEDAKIIREELKGETYFSTAQIYSYLMEVYSKSKDYEKSLKYAKLYYDVLKTQYKTEDIKIKIIEVETKILKYKERLGND